MPETQASSNASLPNGSTLGGRYQIDCHVRATAFGFLYQATDTSTGNPVSIELLNESLLAEPKYVQALQHSAAKASQVEHKNVARVFEVATDGQQAYLVSEFLDGHPLQELLRRKQAEGATFSPKQVDNITAHLCSAVEACSKIGGHGAVTLESVTVNKAGRVKLTGLSLGILAPAVKDSLGARLSPETHSGASPASSADVYGVGAVVYELLVGAPPQKGCKRPSQAVPGLSEMVDQFVGATTNPDKSKRPAVGQLGPAASKALTSPSATQPQQSAAQAAAKPVSAAQPARPSLAQSIAAPQTAETPRVSASHSAALQQALADDTHERWLITKGKLDYGPFSLSSIVEQINTNQILPGNTLVDNETGSRQKVEDNPLLADLVDAAKQKRDDERRANAEVAHAKQERSRGAALYLIVAAAVIGLGGGAYGLVKALSSDDADDKSKIASLDEGSLEAKISFPSKAQASKRRSKHRRGRRSKGKGGDRGKAGGWDDSLDFDMAGADVGSERLSNGQVNPVIQRSGGKLGRCLNKTKTSDAFIEFMVKGTGKVYQVRVNGSTSTPISKCVRKVMMSMKFPTFDGIRSKHNFDMSF